MTLNKVMIDRNVNGQAFEKAGQIDKATELYEANIADRFIGTHPYDRLRVIYSRRKRYTEAIRVCKAFVNVLDEHIKKGSRQGDLKKVREEFINWIQKLEKKNQTEQNPASDF